MRTINTLFTFALFLLVFPATAQGDVSLELRGAASFPTSSLADADLNSGAGIEFLVSYEIIQNGSLYVGWGWNRMTSEELVVNQETDVEDTGYRFGVEYAFPINNGPSSIFVMGGGLYNHLEFEDSDGEIFEDTGHGLGWNVGAGLNYQVSESISLRPSLKYFSLNRDMEMNSETQEVLEEYLSAGLGLAFRF